MMHSSLDAEWKIVLAYLVQYIYISHKNKPIFETAYQIMYVVWEKYYNTEWKLGKPNTYNLVFIFQKRGQANFRI